MNERDLSLAVLAVLRQRLDDKSDDYKGWTLPITVALAVGAEPSAVIDEYHVLAVDGEVDLNEKIGGLQTLAKITSRGIARLVKLSKAKRAAATRPTVTPIPAGTAYRYDVFVSHASEDTDDFVEPLVAELKRLGVSSWYDRERMTYGDAIIQAMKDGLRHSRCGIIVASPHYFGKTFTTPELNALLMRALTDESRKVIAVLYQMDGRELSETDPILATRMYIDAAQYDPAEIAAFIRAAVSPDVERLAAPVALNGTADTDVRRARELGVSPFSPGTHNAPYDALPEQPHLAAFRPRIEIAWYEPAHSEAHPAISWTLANAGAGDARDVHVFLPGIASYDVGALAVGGKSEETRRFDDRYAYHEIMKQPIQAIVEFADVHGNVYREYADVQAGPRWHDTPADYKTTQFGHAYPVSGRIVEPDTDRDRFFLTAPIGRD